MDDKKYQQVRDRHFQGLTLEERTAKGEERDLSQICMDGGFYSRIILGNTYCSILSYSHSSENRYCPYLSPNEDQNGFKICVYWYYAIFDEKMVNPGYSPDLSRDG